MKVSFITTCLNEKKAIGDLLNSLLIQSKKPDEVIIVDAGSTDKTVSIIKNHPANKNLIIRTIILKGVKRSAGRNLAIKNAKHQFIAVSDVGNRLDKAWLKRITKPLINKTADSVAGYYLTDSKSIFQKAIAPFVATMPDKLDVKTFLPSSRSIAFTKKAWQKVGGYPEKLNTCEDLVFASNLKHQTNMTVIPQALVYWRQVSSLKDFFIMIKNHTIGDIQAKFTPHLKKILSIFLRYLIFSVAPVLFPFYLLSAIFKNYHYINHPLALFYLPLLRLTTDLAIIIGTISGVIIKPNDTTI